MVLGRLFIFVLNRIKSHLKCRFGSLIRVHAERSSRFAVILFASRPTHYCYHHLLLFYLYSDIIHRIGIGYKCLHPA